MFTTHTIYSSLKDYPGEFVCRRHFALAGRVVPESELFARAASLDDCRKQLLRKAPGLVRLDRDPKDDATIVEVWL